MDKTAILVDGAFFLKRYPVTYGPKDPPDKVATTLFTMCLKHVQNTHELYRIFFYDCPPLSKKAHHPITGKAIDFSKTGTFAFRTKLHKELVKLRKLAIRWGRLADYPGGWIINPDSTKEILSGKKKVDELTEEDVKYEVSQKGVDMRIGLDIASLSYKRMVDRIVLVTGDADFVPAA